MATLSTSATCLLDCEAADDGVRRVCVPSAESRLIVFRGETFQDEWPGRRHFHDIGDGAAGRYKRLDCGLR